jgi:chorismate mutase-like protein
MAMPSPSLDDLRRSIDEIDDQLHDLLMKRMELVGTVAAHKRRNGTPALRPGREAVILRRLARRHKGAFPIAAIVRIWREMLAATVGMQTNFAVAAYAPEGGNGYWDLARDHFGSHTTMTPYNSIGQVVRAVTDRQATIGILPMPQEDDRDPWWRFIVSTDETTPRILARLPFAGRGNARSDTGDALVIGTGTLEATGDDRSLVVVETRGDISRARIFSALAASSLSCTFFASVESGPEMALNLIEITAFATADDARLASFRDGIGGAVERIIVIGSYAAPLAAAGRGKPRT